MRNLLVTGGAGFIGTNFVYLMVSRGYNVTVLDKLTYAGGKDNLESVKDKIRLVIGDICDSDLVKNTLKGIEIVVHMAAESHNTRSETNPDLFFHTNVEGSRIMMEESANAGVKKFIHISTDEVYGPISEGYFSEEDKIPGDAQATSAYSKSKSLADDLAMDSGRNGFPVIIIRPTNNFGAWQYPEKALPRWITNLLLGKKVPLWGEGQQVRDWLYAEITAKAIEFLIEEGEEGNAYNIAANHQPEITNRKAAEWICEILGLDKKAEIDLIPDPRPNHDFRYALNTSKIKKRGFNIEYDIRRQFEQTVEWYRKNELWWKRRKAEAESIYNK